MKAINKINRLGSRVANERLTSMGEEERQTFGQAFSRLVEVNLCPEGELLPNNELEIPVSEFGRKEDYIGRASFSDRTRYHLTNIAQFLDKAYRGGTQDNETTWQRAIDIALVRDEAAKPAWKRTLGSALLIGTYRKELSRSEILERREAALIMSSLSGIPLSFEDVPSREKDLARNELDLLKANRYCEELAVLDPDAKRASLVSRPERSILAEIIKRGEVDKLLLNVDKFHDIGSFKPQLVRDSYGCMRTRGGITDLASLYNALLAESDPDIMPESFTKAMSIFGEYVGQLCAGDIYDMMHSKFGGAFIRDLRIAMSGQDGAYQLKDRLASVKTEVFRGHLPRLPETTPLVVNYLKPIVRQELGENGSKDNYEYLEILQLGEQPLKEYYQPAEIHVDRAARRGRETFEIPEDAAAEYKALAEDLAVVKEIYSNSPLHALTYDELVNKLVSLATAESQKLQTGIEVLKNKLAKSSDNWISKQIAEITEQQALLRSIKPETMKDTRSFVGVFSKLARHKSLTRPLRQMLLLESLTRFPSVGLSPTLTAKKANIKNITAMQDFVTRVTKQETWRTAFGDRRARTALERVLGGGGLNHAISLYQKRASAGKPKTAFGLIPTRGPLMELSGQIADACWARTYESIARKFPNFTCVLIVKNPNKRSARFAGASLLIETKSDLNEELLVIRGLNPLETDINALDQESFFQQFTGYVRGIAAKAGRKPAIAIDNHAGGAGTNRPQLYDYLDELRGSLSRVKVRSKDTTFNLYDISTETYLI